MKSTLALIGFLLLCAWGAKADTNRFPILRGVLQSDLNGGGFGLTNANTITAAHFSGDGAGLTGVTASGAQGGSLILTNLAGLGSTGELARANQLLPLQTGSLNLTNLSGLGSTGELARIDQFINFATNLTNSGILWVDKNGTIGQRGKRDKPFSTISNAVAAAQAGDWVVVLPATTDYAEHDLLKVGVNYIIYGSLFYKQATNDDGKALWDDRTTGPTTNTIISFGPMTFHGTTNFITKNVGQVIVATSVTGNTFGQIATITNATSRIIINAAALHYGNILNTVQEGVFLVNGKLDLTATELIDDFCGASIVLTNTGAGGATVTKTGISDAVVWYLGTIHYKIPHVLSSRYAQWGSEPVGNTTEASLWCSCDLQEGKTYMDCNSTNYTTWNNVNKIICTNGTGAAGICYDIFGSGKHYLIGNEKLEGATCISTSPGPISSNQLVYVQSQKLTSTFTGLITHNSGTLRMQLPAHYDDGGSVTTGITTANAGTTLYLNGGDMKVLNGRGVLVGTNTTAIINGLRIDTSTTDGANNQPIFVQGAGLKLQNSALIGPATPASIEANFTNMPVKIYGAVVANKAVGTNITQQVLTVTADSNVN